MRNIASLFKLETTGMYLVEEIGSVVLFPLEDGRFKSNQIVMEATYEVHGQPAIVQGETTAASNATQSQSSPGVPFGTYTTPTYSLPPPHPPRPKKSTLTKTIVLVSLQLKDGQTPSSSKASKIDFQVVTNIVLTLEPSQCNLATVGKPVAQQVGFEVILLDSKAYPLLPSDATSGAQFWKSTRKVLAASKTLYEKCTGHDANVMRACGEEAAGGEPAPKRKKTSESESTLQDLISSKFSSLEERLGSIDKKLAFLNELGHGFDCIICKSSSISPVVSPCCQRVVGCQECVNSWMTSHQHCPLCSTDGVVSQRFVLKGFTDVLSMLHAQN